MFAGLLAWPVVQHREGFHDRKRRADDGADPALDHEVEHARLGQPKARHPVGARLAHHRQSGPRVVHLGADEPAGALADDPPAEVRRGQGLDGDHPRVLRQDAGRRRLEPGLQIDTLPQPSPEVVRRGHRRPPGRRHPVQHQQLLARRNPSELGRPLQIVQCGSPVLGGVKASRGQHRQHHRRPPVAAIGGFDQHADAVCRPERSIVRQQQLAAQERESLGIARLGRARQPVERLEVAPLLIQLCGPSHLSADGAAQGLSFEIGGAHGLKKRGGPREPPAA